MQCDLVKNEIAFVKFLVISGPIVFSVELALLIMGIVFLVTEVPAPGMVILLLGVIGVSLGGVMLAVPMCEAHEHGCYAGFCPCTESGYRELEAGLRKRYINMAKAAFGQQ